MKPNNPGQSQIEQDIRRATRCGMTDGTVMAIEFISGFELFNDRPYHNYETWAQGWRVSGLGVHVKHESLSEAVSMWINGVAQKREGRDIPRWQQCDDTITVKLLSDWIAPGPTASYMDDVK